MNPERLASPVSESVVALAASSSFVAASSFPRLLELEPRGVLGRVELRESGLGELELGDVVDPPAGVLLDG